MSLGGHSYSPRADCPGGHPALLHRYRYILALLQLLIKLGLLNSIKLCLYSLQWLLSQYFHGSGKLTFRVVLHLQFHAALQTSKL